MKRLGVLSIIGCSVSGVAIAAGVDCNIIPTCTEMGFTKSVTDCEEQTVLRCPFDISNDNAVFCSDKLCSDEYNLDVCPENGDCEECGGKQKFNGCNSGYTLADGNVCCSDEYYNLTAKPDNATVEQCGNKYHFTGCEEGYTEENGSCVFPSKTCVVGDILYNDLKCYTTAPSSKTAIGVVFDTTNKLAIGLAQVSSRMWSSSTDDISNLTNCYLGDVKTTCGTDGKANTAIIIASGNKSSSYAPGYCYNLTTGGLSAGSWFLPSVKELNTLYSNKSVVNATIANIGGTTFVDGGYWSSNERNSAYAWMFNAYNSNIEDNSKNTYKYKVICAVGY